MVRLSIVVPALRSVEQLESSLVSILSHRPPRSEVVVVLSEPYADPYELEDEVRFVHAPPGSGWVESVNVGIEAAAAPLVHVLTPGVEAGEGWTAAVPRHFDDPQVAAVAPLVVDADDPTRVLAAGVQYRASGRRCLVGVGLSASAIAESRPAALGPTRLAGFYRKSAVQLLGGFDRSVGDQLSDVDLAFRLQFAGFTCVSEPHCQIMAKAQAEDRSSRIRDAHHTERMFWRNLAAQWPAGSIITHAALVGKEFVLNLPRLAAPAALLGRFAAAMEFGTYVRHHHQLRHLREQVAAELAASGEPRRRLRFDPAHAVRGTAANKTGAKAVRRLAA